MNCLPKAAEHGEKNVTVATLYRVAKGFAAIMGEPLAKI